MNKNHPNKNILDQFAVGDTEDTLSIVISAHVEGCQLCTQYVVGKEVEASVQFMKKKDVDSKKFKVPDFSNMKQTILEQKDLIKEKVSEIRENKTLCFKNKVVELPSSLLKIKDQLSPWKSLGSISYAKINMHGLENIYFVHFEPGAKISEHTHDGNEYAFVVAGSFKDQHSEYITGDFASFTHEDSHHPFTEDPDGCLLLVSMNGPFYFKQGWARILNPIRKYLFNKL